MEPLTLITEIHSLSPVDQFGGQHQRPPFTSGQFLQGTITAQQGPHHFTLDIGGRQLATESSAPLQVGQKLDLQVTSLVPQVELRIIPSNPLTQQISSALHLLGQVATTVPQLDNLAQEARQLPQLSPTARETLQLFSDSLISRAEQHASPPLPLAAQLFDTALTTATAPPGTRTDTPTQFNEISRILLQLAGSGSLSPQAVERAVNLAALFARAAAPQAASPFSSLETATLAALPPAIAEQFLGKWTTIPPQDPGLAALLSQAPLSPQSGQALAENHPLRQLFAFLAAESGKEPAAAARLDLSGQQVETVLKRLGLQMERLFAENRPHEAVQTLKYALLEMSQQANATEASALHADQLVKTIELYQMLQIRLAGESLFFMPLPFSFLTQGYLLIDSEQPGNQASKKGGLASTDAHHVTLHLQLEGLGNLEIDILCEQDRIALKFLAEDVERAKYIQGFRGELEQWLTAGRLDSVQFLVGAKEPTKLLLEKLVHGLTGMVDTTA
ncbi:hypothetical protein Despr_2171 [Desulfobulbus propionicus DSM 2032]|uniref:Flagellar hook-length control protein-like C-terminal domain-containing protein n=1 Tax=Desulfobulbus propionicus (strain ATCC 33891 / DSM 2032 / VKM B-1956 / 1pr3) TaxID=577650 RepID=A0A7U4DPM9_DESPD|nr:hypothetical protein [Desulfobulbus propionicus]ADW18316.1 hypothetical protein Despr_2171 [Desulfobulbus propionicus DSM 2032]